MATDASSASSPVWRVRGTGPTCSRSSALLLVAAVGLWLLVNFVKTPADFYNLFLIGLTNGCVYGLVALGYSLVYGILELINFAHGDVFMLGGMLVATMTTNWALTQQVGRGALAVHPPHAPDRDGVLRDHQHDDRDRRLPALTQRPAARAR